jgi:hypothetical protein
MRSLVRIALVLIGLVGLDACGPNSSSGDDTMCVTAGTSACSGACVDLTSDPQNCGSCGNACGSGMTCTQSACVPVQTCSPGAVDSCYDGPAGTEGVGPCVKGTHTCSPTGTWGACMGEVTPTDEVCGNAVDEDCSGALDDSPDADGDGWRKCDGDCCDSTADGCTAPELVNPGAFDVAGNLLDDDCDGTIDNGTASSCDMGLTSNSSIGMDYAKAMELCQTADPAAPPSQRKWGVISAELVLPSGSGTPAAASHSIRPGFGGTNVQGGMSFVELSTGHAADQNDASPGFAAFQGGADNATSSAVPADWLAANGGNFPNAPGCPDPQGGATGHDPVMLKLTIRVPTNAKSFSLATNFFSSEYPEWVCSAFNDFFVVLLDSSWAGSPANPADKNLATYTAPGGQKYPVGVNLAFGDTGLFRECLNGPTGCGSGSVAGNTSTCTGTAELAGTGMDVVNPPSQFPGDPGVCGASNLAGGGTGWLVTSGNVVGGETITLRLAIWDTGDQWYDSVVLVDNFQWSLDAAQPGTVVN